MNFTYATRKSKLRNLQEATLGPQYAGSRINRKDIDATGEEHDPFEDDSDSSSDNADLNQGQGSSGSEGKYERNGFQDDNDTADTSDSYHDMEESSIPTRKTLPDENREELRRLMQDDSVSMAAAITQANKVDTEKGMAVKKQMATFDALLNIRIRLQQGLVACNSLPEAQQSESEVSEVLASTEAAAMRLWNTMEEMKNLLEAQTGMKRKRVEISSSSADAEIWNQMQERETSSKSHRRQILQRWSEKTKAATIKPLSRRLDNSVRQNDITDVLDEQLANLDRWVKRTQVPRSCAPLQASKGIAESKDIYDDADFYGVALKELLERRKVEAASHVPDDIAAQQWRAAKDVKVKKSVDTKASKGRKMRYTVHERIQNFMAPEARGTWEERQIDELFGSLLGKRLALVEGNEDEHEDVRNGEEEALRLFRD